MIPRIIALTASLFLLPLASFAGPSIAASISTSDTTCRFSKDQVSDSHRRGLHRIASKGNFSYPFQTTREVFSEYKRNGGNATCDQFTQQIDSMMTSYRAAVEASNRINNGPPLGLQCNSGQGAAMASACASVALLYSAQSVAAICHQVCD